MLDSILNSAKGMIGDKLGEFNVSPDKLDDVVELSGDAVKENLMEEATSGKLDGVMNLLKGKANTDESNPIVSGIVKSLGSKLVGKLGLDAGTSNQIASSVIPLVMNMVSSKFQSSESSDDASGVASFLGMDGGDMMDKAKDMLGGSLGKLFG